MSLTAAGSGFVVFLLSVQVIQGRDGWGVTYTPTQICAVKGSTVEMSCRYREHGRAPTIVGTFWFRRNEAVDVRTDSQYAGRVQHSCYEKSCTLRITDLRERDSAEYKLRIITNQPGGSYTGWSGVTLSVTDLQVQVSRSQRSSRTKLKCHSSCFLPGHPSYIWYKNGQNILETKPYYSGNFNSTDSVSCAVKGLEDFPSPSVCVFGQTCYRVTYTDRNICAFKGSSVNISCTYSSNNALITSKFWFSPERVHQWQSPSQPEDLSEDSQYAGRVQVLETERGRSTLRITDLTESDSAEYHFRFKTPGFEWRSSLPGTTLTVTALQVQVARITVHQYYTEAELKCHSSCSPAGHFSYVWFNNGQEITGMKTSSYKYWFYPEDIISCGLKGRNTYTSPSVYAPKVPFVSVSTSGDIVESSSVNLTCNSDANPAANYTWYKADVNIKPPSKEPQLVFSAIQTSDSGTYSCTAENEFRRTTSESISINVKCSKKSIGAGSIAGIFLVIFLAVIFLSVFLFIRRKKSSKQTTERPDNKAQENMASVCNNPSAAGQREPVEEWEDLCYASVSFSKNREDALHSNFWPAQSKNEEEEEEEDSVEYTTIIFKSVSASPKPRSQNAAEDSTALYSTVTKKTRV